jgi:hypothetical protein
MSKDPIVDEVRRVREAGAAKHGFQVKAILDTAKKRNNAPDVLRPGRNDGTDERDSRDCIRR